MQIDFEAKKLKEAKEYVYKLTPIKLPKSKERLDGGFYAREENPSFVKKILNFLFK